MAAIFDQYYYTYAIDGGLRVVASSNPERNIDVGSMCMAASFDQNFAGDSRQLVYDRVLGKFLFMNVRRLANGEGERTARFIHAYELAEGEDYLAPEYYFAPDDFYDGEDWRSRPEMLPQARFEPLCEGFTSVDLCRELSLTAETVSRIADMLYGKLIFGSESIVISMPDCSDTELNRKAGMTALLMHKMTPRILRRKLTVNTNIFRARTGAYNLSFTNQANIFERSANAISLNGSEVAFPPGKSIINNDICHEMMLEIGRRTVSSDDSLSDLMGEVNARVEKIQGDTIGMLPSIAMSIADSCLKKLNRNIITMSYIAAQTADMRWIGTQREITMMVNSSALYEAEQCKGTADDKLEIINNILRVSLAQPNYLTSQNTYRIIALVIEGLYHADPELSAAVYNRLSAELRSCIDQDLDRDICDAIEYIPESFSSYDEFRAYWKDHPKHCDPTRSKGRKRVLSRAAALTVRNADAAVQRQWHENIKNQLGRFSGEYENAVLALILKQINTDTADIGSVRRKLEPLSPFRQSKRGLEILARCSQILSRGVNREKLREMKNISDILGVNGEKLSGYIENACVLYIHEAVSASDLMDRIAWLAEKAMYSHDEVFTDNFKEKADDKFGSLLSETLKNRSLSQQAQVCRHFKTIRNNCQRYIGQAPSALSGRFASNAKKALLDWLSNIGGVDELKLFIDELWENINYDVIGPGDDAVIIESLGRRSCYICRNNPSNSYSERVNMCDKVLHFLEQFGGSYAPYYKKDYDAIVKIKSDAENQRVKHCRTRLNSCRTLQEIQALAGERGFSVISADEFKNKVLSVAGDDDLLSARAANSPAKRCSEYEEFIDRIARTKCLNKYQIENMMAEARYYFSEIVKEWNDSQVESAKSIEQLCSAIDGSNVSATVIDKKICTLADLQNNYINSLNVAQMSGDECFNQISRCNDELGRVYNLRKKLNLDGSSAGNNRVLGCLRNSIARFSPQIEDLGQLVKVMSMADKVNDIPNQNLTKDIRSRIIERLYEESKRKDGFYNQINHVQSICAEQRANSNRTAALWDEIEGKVKLYLIQSAFYKASTVGQLKALIGQATPYVNELRKTPNATVVELRLNEEMQEGWLKTYNSLADRNEYFSQAVGACKEIINVIASYVRLIFGDVRAVDNYRDFLREAYARLSEGVFRAPEDIHCDNLFFFDGMEMPLYVDLDEHLCSIVEKYDEAYWYSHGNLIDSVQAVADEIFRRSARSTALAGEITRLIADISRNQTLHEIANAAQLADLYEIAKNHRSLIGNKTHNNAVRPLPENIQEQLINKMISFSCSIELAETAKNYAAKLYKEKYISKEHRDRVNANVKKIVSQYKKESVQKKKVEKRKEGSERKNKGKNAEEIKAHAGGNKKARAADAHAANDAPHRNAVPNHGTSGSGEPDNSQKEDSASGRLFGRLICFASGVKEAVAGILSKFRKKEMNEEVPLNADASENHTASDRFPGDGISTGILSANGFTEDGSVKYGPLEDRVIDDGLDGDGSVEDGSVKYGPFEHALADGNSSEGNFSNSDPSEDVSLCGSCKETSEELDDRAIYTVFELRDKKRQKATLDRSAESAGVSFDTPANASEPLDNDRQRNYPPGFIEQLKELLSNVAYVVKDKVISFFWPR